MDIRWSYGSVVVIEKDAFPDPAWSYGEITLYYEYKIVVGDGWTGKIMGVINPAKINGVAVANIAKVNNV